MVIAFVIWGAGTITISKQSSSPYAGSVGHEKISQKELITTLRYYDLLAKSQANNQETTQNQKETKEKELSEPPLSFDQLQALAWQTIALSREAKHEGIQVSDEEVRQEVEKLFSIGPSFNEQFYRNWIHTNFRGQPRDFEEVVRKHLAVQKIRQKVLEGVPVKDRETYWLKWLAPVLGRTNIHAYSSEKSETND